MPIHVICPGCHASFKVSSKFAGKKGPCPKCKEIIRVPKTDEQVVIHAPEHSEEGARDAQGRYVLKPVARKDTKFQPLVAVGIGAAAILVLLVAVLLRGSVDENRWVLAVGALVLAPPLCLGGYTFLRDPELQGYTGVVLAIRTAICAILYAGTWAAYTYLYFRLMGDAPVETWNILPFAVIFFSLGAGIAYVCYDLELSSGFFHYSFYLLVTIVLRVIMGLPPL
jgi:hypothetical protein